MELQHLDRLAKEYQLSIDRLERDCKAGKLPHWQIAGDILVDPTELLAFCRVEPKPEVTSGFEAQTAKKQVKLTSSTK